MQILLIMLIVVLLAFSVLLLALAKQSPREKQTEDKEQEEYIRDYAETVRQTGGSMKKLEHWKVIAIYLIIYDIPNIAVDLCPLPNDTIKYNMYKISGILICFLLGNVAKYIHQATGMINSILLII